MRKYFEEQLKDPKKVTEEKLKELKGRTSYSEYEVGDIVLVFLDQEIGEKPKEGSIYTEPSITFKLELVAEKDLDKLDVDYTFVRMSQVFPVLERKRKDETSSN